MLHYLIDGYNVLFALPQMPPGTWLEKRVGLLLWLSQMRPQGKNLATVVFDSRQGLGDKGNYHEIDVIFTAGETADDWIIRRVRQAPNPRMLVVVSDDQGIHRMVKGTGVHGVSAREFIRRVKTPAASSRPVPALEPALQDRITDEMRRRWLAD